MALSYQLMGIEHLLMHLFALFILFGEVSVHIFYSLKIFFSECWVQRTLYKQWVLVFCQLFSSIQSLSHVQLFVALWTAAHQASLSITNSWSLIKSMPSKHLILCHPLLLPSGFPNIRVFSNESFLCIRWPKYWSFSFKISASNEYSGLISFRIDWLDLLAVQGT